jgi:hypothetical protein
MTPPKKWKCRKLGSGLVISPGEMNRHWERGEMTLNVSQNHSQIRAVGG